MCKSFGLFSISGNDTPKTATITNGEVIIGTTLIFGDV